MARFVRPSWVDLQIDGYKSNIMAGPKRKDGSMVACFYVRDKKNIVKSVSVSTYSTGQYNILRVYDKNGNVILEHKTDLD